MKTKKNVEIGRAYKETTNTAHPKGTEAEKKNTLSGNSTSMSMES